jgi:hypothetical protein
MKTVVTMAVLAAMAVFGLRVLVATGAWQECGMPGDAAFIRAIIDFGARPGALECAGVALARPAPTPAPPSTTTPPPTPTEPDPWAPGGPAYEADARCVADVGKPRTGGTRPLTEREEETWLRYHECMKREGIWVPID